ncbi:hypothetical protein [Vreelandella zhaodongensis]|nr:hypothetical protein [Halomonas zhaodongensis]
MMAFEGCPVGMMLPQAWFAPELQHRTEMAKGKLCEVKLPPHWNG